MLQYPIVLAREPDRRRIWAFERAMRAKVLLTAGVFPAEPTFYRRFVERYVEDLRRLDSVGLDPHHLSASLDILGFHGIEGDVARYPDQEPDHSLPSDETRCWLPHLRGRRVLLVSPFAKLLARRATRETFEAVWARNAKPWFHPARVEALEFPYGYARTTWERFPTSLDLLEHITTRIAHSDFDVAIIGAGGIGIPIAGFVKGLGRVGISLGGPIQPIFGVMGERFRGQEEWRRHFNDAWVDMPSEYRPDPSETMENYW